MTASVFVVSSASESVAVPMSTRLVYLCDARWSGKVSVPDTAMIAGALEYAQRISEPYLLNHCSQQGSGN
jgi:hypothetical protein